MSVLRIGAFDVEILEGVDVDLDLARDGNTADSDVEYLTIRLRGDVPAEVRREALIHEILHHAFSQTALPEIVGESEEIIVRSLSPILATCLDLRESPRRSGGSSR